MFISSFPLLHLLLSPPSLSSSSPSSLVNNSSVPRVISKYIETPLLVCEPENERNKVLKEEINLNSSNKSDFNDRLFDLFSLKNHHYYPFSNEKKAPRLKFDLRFIVMLHSLSPFNNKNKNDPNDFPLVLIYKQFWIRLANEFFSLDNFNKYEKHYTVMNYKQHDDNNNNNKNNNVKWIQMSDVEFISLFDEQNERRNKLINNINKQIEIEKGFRIKTSNGYLSGSNLIKNENNNWETMKKKIYKMIKEFFVYSTSSRFINNNSNINCPLTINHQPNSRAMYGLLCLLFTLFHM
jgi:hypothetical protein